MGAVRTKIGADLRRKRLQAVALATVLFLASGAATLALSILIESNAPFDRAFDRANGAHLVVDFDASISDAQLHATATNPGVTASAGPWPVATAAFEGWSGAFLGNQMVSGRPQPDDSIDRVTMQAGRWWLSPGEAVIDQDTALLLAVGVGDSLPLHAQPAGGPKFVSDGAGGTRVLPGEPEAVPEPLVTITIVGIAASVSTPDVAIWMHPSDVSKLAPTLVRQMLYRVDPAATDANLSAAKASIVADLPADAVLESLTYLETRSSVEDTARLYVPVLLAFSAFALAAAAFTIANVVSGVVLTSYRDIGVMKAVGFTPAQVTTILLAQILLPAVVGTVAGIGIGTLASRPTVEATAQSFGLPATFVLSVPAIAAVLVVSIVVALVAGLVPAVRAGQLSAVGAIVRGTTPSQRPGGGRLRRLGLRMPAPLPIRLGIAAGAAHPLRSTMTLGAVLVGVAAVVFAIGLNGSLIRIMQQVDRDHVTPVRAVLAQEGADNDWTGTILDLPGTARAAAVGQDQVVVPGLGRIEFIAYQGDASWLGFELIEGRWFAGPGEAVAPTSTFSTAGVHVGDTIEITGSGGTIEVRLVGEVLEVRDVSRDGLAVSGTWSDLTTVEPAVGVSRWEVQPEAGVEPHVLAESIRTATAGAVEAFTIRNSTNDEEFLLFLSVVAFMGVVLVAMSLGGVFNTVLLETRQRTREMAVLKAIGLTPAQVVVMVVSSVVPVGLIAGLLGVPIGLAFQRAVMNYLATTAAQTRLPESTFDVFPAILIVGLALAGLAIAAAGAYVPAQRAARSRIAPVLQAE